MDKFNARHNCSEIPVNEKLFHDIVRDANGRWWLLRIFLSRFGSSVNKDKELSYCPWCGIKLQQIDAAKQ